MNYPITAYSWQWIDEKTLTKHSDRDLIEHQESIIPIEVRGYFKLYGTDFSRDIVGYFHGERYKLIINGHTYRSVQHNVITAMIHFCLL